MQNPILYAKVVIGLLIVAILAALIGERISTSHRQKYCTFHVRATIEEIRRIWEQTELDGDSGQSSYHKVYGYTYQGRQFRVMDYIGLPQDNPSLVGTQEDIFINPDKPEELLSLSNGHIVRILRIVFFLVLLILLLILGILQTI